MKLTPVGIFSRSSSRQRRSATALVLARAKILPKAVVDEPVSMLDAPVRVEILQLLQRMQEELNRPRFTSPDLPTVRYFSAFSPRTVL